jgi:predicted enzyme related to lactoylglutathione lyase
MPTRDSYLPGVPNWIDLATGDPAGAKAFYAGLFGWTYDDIPMGDGNSYSMALIDGRKVAAIGPQQEEQSAAGVPPHWQMYINAPEVDAATAKVATAGGTVLAGPFDVMDAGRMSVVADPSGAIFQLWQAKGTIGAELVNEHGAFIWSELITPDPAAVAAFYETVTGLHLISADPGDGSSYSGFSLDGTVATMLAGTMAPMMPNMPTVWNVYIGSDDVDATAAKVVELGGSVMAPPFDIPVGRMSVLVDPQGAVFSVFKG